MNPRPWPKGGAWLAAEEDFEDKRITEGYDDSEGLDFAKYIEFKRVSKSVSSLVASSEGGKVDARHLK